MVRLSERVVHCIKNPLRIIDFITERNFRWQKLGDGFKRKNYRSYDEYISHQRSKLGKIGGSRWLKNYEVQFRNVLRDRLDVKPGRTVLCLGARTGAEVQSFLDKGCFAVGIDLNPGKDNKYVLRGDFHDLQFPSDSVDIIYTNSIDHVFNPEKFITEIRRVLKPKGMLVLEVMETKDAQYYESFDWNDVNDLIGMFKKQSFTVKSKSTFDSPWEGSQFIMELREKKRDGKKT